MFRRLSLAAALLLASSAFADRRATLSISVTVVRSVAVSVSEGPSGATVSVRAPDGVRRLTLIGGVPPERAIRLPGQAVSSGEPGYLVVTVLADAPLRN